MYSLQACKVLQTQLLPISHFTIGSWLNLGDTFFIYLDYTIPSESFPIGGRKKIKMA